MKSLCVFCGSNKGSQPSYLEKAQEFGALLAKKGIRLVYGGANNGLMGALADSCLAAGGEVLGIIPDKLLENEMAHEGLTEIKVVKTMHERKLLMYNNSDAFVSLPGGFGTLEEIFEIFTWNLLGFHDKPCSFLNINDYYSPLLTFLNHMANEKFVKTEQKNLLIFENDMHTLLEKLEDYKPVRVSKWID